MHGWDILMIPHWKPRVIGFSTLSSLVAQRLSLEQPHVSQLTTKLASWRSTLFFSVQLVYGNCCGIKALRHEKNDVICRRPIFFEKNSTASVPHNAQGPSDAYMRQIMACRLFDAKLLSEPVLPYSHLDPKEHISVKFYSNSKVSFQEMHLKMSAKWLSFCLGPQCVNRR